MEEFDSIEALAEEMRTKLDSAADKKKVIALYAFNATGKTRLTNILSESGSENESDNEQITVLCYNAFIEDMFIWDNEDFILSFNPNSWIIKLITEQGLENEIVDNFKELISSKIEPVFDFDNGKITFNIVTGDSGSVSNIKISNSEESMLIWSIFYTVLDAAIEALNTNEEDRTMSIFNSLKYIIIDDPVSSVDDTRIIAMAVKLIDCVKEFKGNSVKFFFTTHHALFFNVLVNSFRRGRDSDSNFKSFRLSQNLDRKLRLEEQGDAPFSYHLVIKDMLEQVIQNDAIEKYHFNLFRNLVEKTSNFLGYENWDECLTVEKKAEFRRALNVYSHSTLSDLESRGVSNEDKVLLQEMFNIFITTYKWK